jgi:hypothetical protein
LNVRRESGKNYPIWKASKLCGSLGGNYQIWKASWKLRGSLGGDYQIWEAMWKLGRKLTDLENFVEAWAKINRFGKLQVRVERNITKGSD